MQNFCKAVRNAPVFFLCTLPVQADTWATGSLRANDYTEGVPIQQATSGFSTGLSLENTEFWLNADHSRVHANYSYYDAQIEYSNLDFGMSFALTDHLKVDATYSRLIESRVENFGFSVSDFTDQFENGEIGLTWQEDTWFLRAGFAALDNNLPDTNGNYWTLAGGTDIADSTAMTLAVYVPTQGGSHITALGFDHSNSRFDLSAHYLHGSDALRVLAGQIDWHFNDSLDLQGFVTHQSDEDEDLYSALGVGVQYRISDRAAISGALERVMPDNDVRDFTAFGIGIDLAIGARPKRRMNFAEQAGRPAFFEAHLPGGFF